MSDNEFYNLHQDELKEYLALNYHKLNGYPNYYDDYIEEEYIDDEIINAILNEGKFLLGKNYYNLENILETINRYIDYVNKKDNFINRFGEFNSKADYISFAKKYEIAVLRYIELSKSKTLNNNKNSVFSNTLKKKENFMNKNYEYSEKVNLTIPENCIAKHSKENGGQPIILEKDKQGNTLPIKKYFIVLPQRTGEDFRRKFTIPVASVFDNQINEFKSISLSKAINKENGQEMKFYIAFEKKGDDGKWHDASNDFSNDEKMISFAELTSLIKETFKNLNARKSVDGKDMPATHFMWLPQNAYENQNDANKNVPTCRIVPEVNVITGEKNATAGDIEITLPAYAKIHDFKVFDYDNNSKTFTENANTKKLNLNFAKFYTHNTYTGSQKNKDGLIAVMMPDDAKIRITTAKHTGKDGQIYDSKTYFINANDLREAIKEDYKTYKKALENSNNGEEKPVNDIKNFVANTGNVNQNATNENVKNKDKDVEMPFA